MSFCVTLQRLLQNQFPNWTWRVVENPNPTTSVIILSHGLPIPGEVIVSVFDDQNEKQAESVVAGQAYCDFVKDGQSDAVYASDVGARILVEARLQ